MMIAVSRQPIMQMRKVFRRYLVEATTVDALCDVSIDIRDGESVAIVGPSGSGKSSCANIMGCLDRPSAGTCHIAGLMTGRLDPAGMALVRRDLMGFVFQGHQLLPRDTALRNVELPLAYHGVGRAERLRRAKAALEVVGLADRASHLPAELSGGQQQRVAIARAIVTNPKIIIADEPTAALDRDTADGIIALLGDLNQRLGTTLLVVTHDAEIAARAGRRIRLEHGRVISDSSRSDMV